MRLRLWLWAALCVTPTVVGAKETSSTNIALVASNCFACHGPDGRSATNVPSLQPLNADEIANRMKEFKAGTRLSTIMARHAKAYSDAEIDALADYIANLKKN